ncbi:SSI family serine proteinase inhibitor [Nocardiopsis alba]|uniref:SSI family serine proteinase inhibitor n=1 Tax=Nocardiopsis alba TaxID=53437 RepID=UPI00363210FD
MREHNFGTALPTRLAALAALGLLLTACGNDATEVGSSGPDAEAPQETAPETDPSEETDPTDGTSEENDSDDTDDSVTSEDGGNGDAEVELVIEAFVADEDGLPPSEDFQEGTWTLTCSPTGGDHPDPEAACSEIDELGSEPFVMETDGMACTMQVGGPEAARVTGHVGDTEIDTEFNRHNGCEIERFSDVEAVIAP